MTEQAKIHNDHVARLFNEMVLLTGGHRPGLNVLIESLLLGVAMLNFPEDPRRQALLIQEIADGAQDRAAGGLGEREL